MLSPLNIPANPSHRSLLTPQPNLRFPRTYYWRVPWPGPHHLVRQLVYRQRGHQGNNGIGRRVRTAKDTASGMEDEAGGGLLQQYET